MTPDQETAIAVKNRLQMTKHLRYDRFTDPEVAVSAYLLKLLPMLIIY